jgi:hypothetical protein
MTVSAKVAQGTDIEWLDSAERLAATEADARNDLEEILAFARTTAQASELHEVERAVFARMLSLGRLVLKAFLAKKGTGRLPEGGRATAPTGESLPFHSIKSREYLSIFGEIEIPRAYYWGPAEEGRFPLDAALNLPAQRYSYLLQEWGELLGADGSYEKVTDRLEALLRVKFWSQGVQHVARVVAADVQPFYEQKPAPAPKDEAELLVATIDGKGVPMRPDEPRGSKLRIGPGEKPNKKKEAVVSAVYTIDRHRRTPEDVIREVDEDNRIVAPDVAPPARPRPKNKRVRATMRGKQEAFDEVRRQLDQRDPEGRKQWVALTDGYGPLQDLVLTKLAGPKGIVLILDIMHVLTYLWPVAFAYHDDGTPEASRWVMNKLRLLLEGKVGYVIGTLRQRLGEGGLSKSKRRDFQKAIDYMDANRAFMAYDVYIAEGYPIGSGVAEGACKHLVKDRMECTGMRWSKDGAQAMLDLRSVSINGDWEAFWRFHVAQQRERLYGSRTNASASVGAAAA